MDKQPKLKIGDEAFYMENNKIIQGIVCGVKITHQRIASNPFRKTASEISVDDISGYTIVSYSIIQEKMPGLDEVSEIRESCLYGSKEELIKNL